MASPPPTPTATGGHLLSNGGVKKYGYLRKQKHGHRRFFVLQEATERSPARLEYYESEKKWRNKSAAKRCITLDSCLCVNKRADAKHKHLIALYTKDEYFAVAAENEPEQESWYRVLSELIAEGKVYHSPASTSSLVGFEESSYGPVAPANAAYKEVWQVNLKAKGLGQVKNLVGVYRLCLSGRTISFVKLNSETPAVSLQLMNIRRCGHSDNFFFIEVGRSAVTGPGEFWMQAEDLVVAQNIHETILEAMKAMKELSEFRPRSKSQSASTNPISVPTRRNLNNLPPSQTGLVRRSRTDSTAAMSPGRKFTSCRVRTASEGDGSMTRPVSMSIPITGSPTSLGSHLIRSHTLSSGRTCRILETNLHHSRSTSGSSSPPAASSPLSSSPRAATTALSTPDKTRRPFSCSASISGSLSDNGFMLCDDFSSSPSEARFLPLMRSDTPDSLCSTPPSRDASDPCGYMIMEGSKSAGSIDKSYRKRTHSLTTPRQQRVVAPLSSASLDEYTLMRMGQNSQSASPKVSYPEDYGDIEIGSSRSSSSNLADDGYMPMTPGVAQQSQTPKTDSYVVMSPMCVSAPKQIVNPRVHPQMASGGNYKANSPCGSSLEDSGYMRMYCGSKSSMDSPDRHSEYMNMSPGNPPPLQTPPDYFMSEPARPTPYQANSLTLPARLPTSTNEDNQYVLMSPQNSRQRNGDSDYYSVMQPSQNSPLTPSPIRNARPDSAPYRGRIGRPNRLSLDAVRTLPSMNEHPNNEPRSPGEYINIEFNPARFSPPSTVSTESQASSLGSNSGGPNDYMNLELSVKEEAEERQEFGNPTQERRDEPKGDYQEMSFGMTSSPPQMVPQNFVSGRLPLAPPLTAPRDEHQVGVFHLDPTPDPDRSAKVIRANPTGRRRHSSETFSSTATVTPVPPSFAQKTPPKRHSSVENLSSRSSDGSDEEASTGSPAVQKSGAARADYAAGLNYLALLEGKQEEMVGFKAAHSCKGVVNGLHASPYVCLGFKETATTAKD
ncbi:insulin receptor substrate 2-like [Boleophthalmus pectinirostris]|uniref:insulin receptor substrate 2-like n=1 Tax=Boleophthalmus pectinirostris TaxID=150288 RepID=UPI00242C8C51|nr:insulin receptor substrate 2-like [Boleophthalmus pectinirostris]